MQVEHDLSGTTSSGTPVPTTPSPSQRARPVGAPAPMSLDITIPDDSLPDDVPMDIGKPQLETPLDQVDAAGQPGNGRLQASDSPSAASKTTTTTTTTTITTTTTATATATATATTQTTDLKASAGSRLRNFGSAVIETLRMALSTIYLCYIVLTIPLSFEVGGLNCGLSYSLTILLLYFSLATLRVLNYHRFLSTFLYYMQHMLLPSMLSLFLTVFSDDAGGASGAAGSASSAVSQSHLVRYWWWLVEAWKVFLINSTPLFTILEGFCSLLSIQALGQVSQYLIRYKSDSWSIVSLIVSSCILLTSLYFMVKIYVSPAIDLTNVGMVSASLLGSVFTCLALITVFAIASNRASPLECSLLVAYIVKCAYEIFPELGRSNFNSMFKFAMNEFKKIDSQAGQGNKELLKSVKAAFHSGGLHSLLFSKDVSPDQLFSVLYIKVRDFVTNVLFKFVVENLPRSFEPLWDFLRISISNLTLPILVQLAYRILVFFAATKIIPILQPVQRERDSPLSSPTSQATAASLEHKTKLKRDPLNASTSTRLLYLYSPCVIIAVYTNLMVQHNEELDQQSQLWNWSPFVTIGDKSVHSWQFWNWVNIFTVLLLYFSELVNHDPEDNSLTDHWAQ